ncbi:MAG: peptidase C11 [Lachnospiraceae bacterium]|nr:peptidase C11 [Lachnospiraceae bacterium]
MARPAGRGSSVSGGGGVGGRRGSGLGSGRVGRGSSGSHSSGSSSHHSSGGSSYGGGGRRPMSRATKAGGGGGLLAIIAIVFFMFMSGGDDDGGGGGGLTGLIGGGSSGGGGSSVVSGQSTNSSSVDTNVASGSRNKRTVIKGNGNDVITLMVYICGTDLESEAGMASNDIQEMLKANTSDKVNIIICTGGAKKWQIQGISNSVHQFYKVDGKNHQLVRLEDNRGSKPMTDPATLTDFIKYCAQNYPANRNELILWDHGGGSVTGFGYDEKNGNGDSMTLAGINTALKNAGVTFDFIGFDACLMATAETALMLDNYADYLIASEETEPGIGWYYTNWLTKLSNNTSMPTTEIGKNIIDDFVSACDRECNGQKTTLSITDLAEFSNTVPSKLSAFARSVTDLLNKEEYEKVSEARAGAREFATSSKIDQVDLVNLANNIGTSEAKALSSAIQGAVKYNKTSSNMKNAYGISIYFPYKKAKQVDAACKTYNQIGMDAEYTKCIKQFASLETSGVISSGGSGSILDSLFGGGEESSSSDSGMIEDLLGMFFRSGGSEGNKVRGLDETNIEFLKDSGMSTSQISSYIAEHHFDTKYLNWVEEDGKYLIDMPDQQWNMIHLVDKNVLLDDGEGYIDLGYDNLLDWDDKDRMVANMEVRWIALNNQVVAYYHTETLMDGDNVSAIYGYIPALLTNDIVTEEPVQLLVEFPDGNAPGRVVGVLRDYQDGETEAIAKSELSLQKGDRLDFVCDYYTYDGEYEDSYMFGDPMIVEDPSNLKVTDYMIEGRTVKITYVFTDMYQQEYWTPAVMKKS